MARGRAMAAGGADQPAPTGRVIRVTLHEGMVVKDEPSIDSGAWAATLLDRTVALVGAHPPRSSAGTDVVAASRRDLLAALDALRQLGDAKLRDLAFGGIVGALTLGFHHRGGPEVVKQARRDFAREAIVGGAAIARAGKAGKPGDQEAAAARDLLRAPVFAAWDADPDLLKGRRWEATAFKVFDQFTREIGAHVRLNSIWMPPGKKAIKKQEAYVKRMVNPIRALAVEYKAAHSAV